MFTNLHSYTSIFGVQKQTVASDALFRRLGRERKRLGGTKEIILQEMKTTLSQKLQKTNSLKMTHTHEGVHTYTRTHTNTQRNKDIHTQKHKNINKRAHTWVAFLMPVVVCNWYREFSLCLSTGYTHIQTHTDAHADCCCS